MILGVTKRLDEFLLKESVKPAISENFYRGVAF